MIEKPIILVGDGGHCLSVIDVIESRSYYSVAGIIAPNNKKVGSILGYPVIGTDKDLDRLLVDNENVCVTIGQITTSQHRERLFLKLAKLGANFPVLKSARATVSSHAIIKGGTVVMHGAIVNAAAEVGENCIINSLALIEHNVIVEPHCHI